MDCLRGVSTFFPFLVDLRIFLMGRAKNKMNEFLVLSTLFMPLELISIYFFLKIPLRLVFLFFVQFSI